MRYAAFATDYDGTLARAGRVCDSSVEALRRLSRTGRRLLLVTGRRLDDLRSVFGALDLFDALVVENGAVVHEPATGATRLLAAPPPPEFVAELERRGVTPLAVGDAIVATWHPNEQIALEVIRELGLELQVIFNKGAVMVLPAGVNKASGLVHALDALRLSAHNLVAIGDAGTDAEIAEADDAWRRLGLIAATLTPKELLDLPCRELLRLLFREDDIRLFDGTPVYFQCSCSRERVAGILQALGGDEVHALLRERGDVEVRCEFCNRAWRFDAVDVAGLFSSEQPQSAPPGLH